MPQNLSQLQKLNDLTLWVFLTVDLYFLVNKKSITISILKNVSLVLVGLFSY